MRLMRASVVLAVCFVLAGCMGTIKTRCASAGGRWCGSYPFSGVALDCKYPGVMSEEVSSEDSGGKPWVSLYGIGLFCIPLDLLFDAVLLPADLIGWACGYEKWWPESAGSYTSANR